MANKNQYYKFTFAELGNFTVIPDQASSGNVDYESGFGPDYEKVDGEADRKLIERETFNGLMQGVTKNIKQWQEFGFSTWIEDNGDEESFGYSRNSIVRNNSNYYVSRVNSNQTEPSATNTTEWSDFAPARLMYTVGDGGSLTQTFTQVQSVITKSVGVSGTGGNLTQSFDTVQNIMTANETFIGAPVSASTQSVTLPNGLIMKFGEFVESDSVSDERSWDVPFPNGVLFMSATPSRVSSSNSGSKAIPITNSNFVLKTGDSYGSGDYSFVQAIGY